MHRLGRLVGPRIVVDQAVVGVLEAAGVLLLDRFGGLPVEGLAAADQQAVVGHVLGQGVFEEVARIAVRGLLEEELPRLEVEEQAVEGLAAVPHRAQQLARELAAEHRGGLQEPLVVLRQAVDARHQDALDGARHRAAFAAFGALREGAGQLLEEEGIAFGLGQHLGLELGRQAGVFEDRLGERPAVLVGEPAQRQLGGVGLVHPLGLVARAVGAEQEDAGGAQGLDQAGQEVLGGGVDPVQVLELHHHQRLVAGVVHHLAHGLEGLRLDRLRLELGQRLGAGFDVEQAEEERQRQVGIAAHPFEALPQLGGDGGFVVVVGDLGGAADHVEDRQVGDAAAVGKAAALQVDHLPPFHPPPQLDQEARLAAARLAGDADHLALALRGQLQHLGEHAELAGAADERGQPGARGVLALAAAADPEDRERLALARHGQRIRRLERQRAAHHPGGGVGDQDLVGTGLLPEPRGDVGGGADDHVAHPADHHRAGVEAELQLEVDAFGFPARGPRPRPPGAPRRRRARRAGHGPRGRSARRRGP